MQGCEQVGAALNMPSEAVLCGYCIVTSYMLSPSIVKAPGTSWEEPVLVWLTICMPTGSGKSVLFKHIFSLLQVIRQKCGLSEKDPSWIFDDATLEKMGAMMHDNCSRLLGLYDEITAFLTKSIFFGVVLYQIHTNVHSSYNCTMGMDGEKTQVIYDLNVCIQYACVRVCVCV